MQKKIKIFDLKFDKQYRKKFHKGVDKILDEAFLTNHTFVKKLEKKFCYLNKTKYSVAVNNGTTAIEIILKSINVKNKKVLVGSNTFVATGLAIKNSGGLSEPLDIENEYYSLCPKALKKKINKDIGAVIIIHIGGLVTPFLKEIKKICEKHKVPLVEDCAQAFGSTLMSKKVGNFGLAGAFSFQTTKVVTSGEGGIITTNNYEFYKKLLSNRFYGVDFNNPLSFVHQGSNYKMTELVALSALCDLERSKVRIAKRIKLAKRYQKNLKNSNWKTLNNPKNTTSSYYKQIIISPIKRSKVKDFLEKKKISLTGGVYYKPLHRQPILGVKKDVFFPVSSFFADNHICPPCYPELSLNDIDTICRYLKKLK